VVFFDGLHEQRLVVGVEQHWRRQAAHSAALDRLLTSATERKLDFNNSTAWLNETPRSFMTQSIGPPPIWQLKQYHGFSMA
jgi:hypothetical protein